MGDVIKLKRGTAGAIANATPASGEAVYDKTNNALFVGDASTNIANLKPVNTLTNTLDNWRDDSSVYPAGVKLVATDAKVTLIADGVHTFEELFTEYMTNNFVPHITDGYYWSGARTTNAIDALKDKLYGLEPNGLSTATETSYGLVTSGSDLVATVRSDDVPFPGVKTIAVEEATENLIVNGSFEDGKNGWTWSNDTYNVVTDEDSYFGSYSLKRIVTDPNFSSNDAPRQSIDPSKLIPGETYTFSFYAKVVNYVSGSLNIYFIVSFDDGTSASYAKTIPETTNGWEYFSKTITLPSDKTVSSAIFYIHGMAAGGKFVGEAYIDGVQLERKPFATSFVDGTRANGQLLLGTVDDFGVSENGVLNFWVYTPLDKTLITSDTSIINITPNASWSVYTYSLLMYYETTDGSIKAVYRSDNVSNSLRLTDQIDKTQSWHMVTVVWDKNTATFKMYVDGVLQPAIEQKTTFQGFDKTHTIGFMEHISTLISNLYIGEYDPNLWTDDYIKKLYYAKKPFAVLG